MIKKLFAESTYVWYGLQNISRINHESNYEVLAYWIEDHP